MTLKKADITFENNEFSLTGDIDFFNVMSVYQKSLAQLKQCESLHFNFSGVTSSDSAGLALMVEWVKFGKCYQKSVKFSHVSKDLESIARAAGMVELLS